MYLIYNYKSGCLQVSPRTPRGEGRRVDEQNSGGIFARPPHDMHIMNCGESKELKSGGGRGRPGGGLGGGLKSYASLLSDCWLWMRGRVGRLFPSRMRVCARARARVWVSPDSPVSPGGGGITEKRGSFHLGAEFNGRRGNQQSIECPSGNS